MELVADNLQPMDPDVQKALKTRDAGFFRTLAKSAQKAGAHALDINPGPLGKKGGEIMAFLVDAVDAARDLPLFMDTADPIAMEAGLKRAGRTAVLNGVSPQPGRLSAMLPLARRFKVDVVGFLLSPQGRVCPDTAGRLEAARILEQAAQDVGIDPERLIFDPVLVPLTWGDGPAQAKAVLETLDLLPQLLGRPVRTMAGISNLISGAGPGGAQTGHGENPCGHAGGQRPVLRPGQHSSQGRRGGRQGG